jgi:hypothetical protein
VNSAYFSDTSRFVDGRQSKHVGAGRQILETDRRINLRWRPQVTALESDDVR